MKDFFKKVKEFLGEVKGLGFSAILSLVVALFFLFFTSYNFIFWFCLGIFFTENFHILTRLFDKHIAPKINF